MYDLAHDILRDGNRGRMTTHFDDYTGQVHAKGAVKNAGQPYNKGDVTVAQKLLKKNGVKTHDKHAAELLHEAIERAMRGAY